MKFFQNFGKIRTSGKLYKNLADPGSMLFGGADRANSLGMPRTGSSEGLFGEQDKAIDWFGSPVTAGTDAQPYARLGALLYGSYAGANALGGGGSAGGVTPTSGGSAGPAWAKWLRMAPQGMNAMGGQRQPYQPQWETFDDSEKEAERMLLARLLMEQG